ncbi:MAG: hypothetical protein SFU83_05805 [Meiothermus sp.]|nr:hypothetical protein [Meiothermus sp.]
MGKTLTREEWLELQKAERRSRPSELAGKLEAPPAPPQPVPLDDTKAARRWLSEELRLAAYDVPRPGIRRAILLRARKKLAKRDRG